MASQPLSPSPTLLASPTLWEHPTSPLSTQPGWGPRVGAGPGASWEAAVPSECLTPDSFSPKMHWTGALSKGRRVWREFFLSKWGADGPCLPGHRPHKASGMSSCGWNVTCFIGERFALGERRWPRWKAILEVPVPLQPLLSLLLPSWYPAPRYIPLFLKCECFLPVGGDTQPLLCLLYHLGRFPGGKGPQLWGPGPLWSAPLGHSPGQTDREAQRQSDPSVCPAFPSQG